MNITLKRLAFFIPLCLCFSSCEKKINMYSIGVSQCSIDEWRDQMNQEMINEATLSQNITLTILSSDDNTKKQIADIRSLIKQKIDLLILTPNEVEPITPIIEEIYDSGIPVILVDRKISSDKYTAFIGANNYQIGTEVGRYAVNLLKSKGNIAEIKGLTGSSSAMERHQGFYDVIKNYPKMKIVFEGDGEWLKDGGATQMSKILDIQRPIDLVYVQNDRMAKGAYREALNQGRADGITFIGIDGLPGPEEGVDMVICKKLKATFLYPTGGDKTIQLAINILEEKPFDKETILATSVIDETNAPILKLQTDQIISQQAKIVLLNQRVHKNLYKYTAQRNIMYAVSILALLFSILLIALFRAYYIKNRLNQKLYSSNFEINKQKNELEVNQLQLLSLSKQLEEATHAKLSFFTDITHEFRTPLTLIAGPIEILSDLYNTNDEEYKLIKIVKKNASILLRLVNQIIEFRKVETNNIKMNLSLNNLDNCLNDWNLLFSQLSKKDNINFKYKKESEVDFTFQFDFDKMERIYINLLSNAFKFIDKRGSIYIDLSKVDEGNQTFAQLRISNTGNGLSEKEINNIFERFYRVDSHVAGSGIGLALVKALLDLIKGNITATCKDNLTTFIIKIPFILYANPSQIKEIAGSNELYLLEDIYSLSDKNYETRIPCIDNTYTILIIDDNEEVRFYIRSVLKQKYHILEASDGEEGLSMAYENNIDIIISDIMMPKMNGIELCSKIKEDVKVCHISVILLTACTLDEQRIQGFESGADVYISKPFNAQILEVRIRKILENREKTKKHLRDILSIEESDTTKVITLDEELVIKFRNYVIDRISDINLNVENISSEFGLSRAQFYRKMKAITNQGPNEFIRAIRLNKSVEILKMGKTVAEAAYEVGFTSPSYFTRCFKEFFHKNPSQIK